MRRLTAFFLSLCLLFPAGPAPKPKYLALTFDDGPSGKFTRRLLDGLEERNVKATFLLCGYRMELYPELTERIVREGHEIGIHGYSHKSMGSMGKADILREIQDTAALLPPGYRPAFLRPPGGIVTARVREAAGEAELAILSWDVDPKDWSVQNAETVKNAVVNHVKDGDIILLHDMFDSSVDAALAIVDTLQEQGYTFVTASELAALRGITPEYGKEYHFFQGSSD